jgi:hypothetical protein
MLDLRESEQLTALSNTYHELRAQGTYDDLSSPPEIRRAAEKAMHANPRRGSSAWATSVIASGGSLKGEEARSRVAAGLK